MASRTARTVFLSGVSRGIGDGLAGFFLRRGWRVLGVSRTKPRITHPAFTWRRCDITNPAAVARLFRGRRRRFDCVIANAATGGPVGPALSIPGASWRAVFDANFFSHLEVARHAVRHARPGAAFIFLSGRGAVSPRPFAGPYAISKLAVTKLAEQLSGEYPRFRFYAISPGAHDTRMARAHLRALGESAPEPLPFVLLERLILRLIKDRSKRLSGRLIHVRDRISRLLSLPEGGYIRRIEKRR